MVKGADHAPEAVIFIGLQAAGKSTFYKTRFFNTHIRLNLDMLKTRHRETLLLQTCLQAKQSFVIDNTNPTPADRARYIPAAKAARFKVVGYFFESIVEDALKRNAQREGKARVANVGIFATAKKLIRPSFDEGFDQLFEVRMDNKGDFVVQTWE